MRFVDPIGPRLAVLALPAALAALSGCASLPDPIAAVKQAVGAQAEPAAAPAQAAATAAPAASAAAQAQVQAEPPVDPRAQAAFDNARRAMRAGRNDEAAAQLKALVQSNPELGGVHANLGLLYRQAGKLPESAAALEKAVQVSPRQAVFHNQLGITYRQQGQFAKARDAYERAIALDATYAAPLLNLGILNDLYLQDRKRALALYDQYLVLAGSDAAVAKWVVDLKNRKDDRVALSLKEQQ
ncbi:MAG: tetratricopeptide repeat protein [Ideonella sp.]|nr:tetratricopeptide repeat protein [Ideonella sp.]